jgi:hypothetical protein
MMPHEGMDCFVAPLLAMTAIQTVGYCDGLS